MQSHLDNVTYKRVVGISLTASWPSGILSAGNNCLQTQSCSYFGVCEINQGHDFKISNYRVKMSDILIPNDRRDWEEIDCMQLYY